MIREAVVVPERNFASWSGREPATIWYFGDSYSFWINLHERTKAGHRLAPVGDVINRWAQELTEPLRNLDAAMVICDPLAWTASGIGSRGRFESPVVSFACCLAAFIEAMEAGGRHVFVVGDDDLGQAMYDAAHARRWQVGWVHPKAGRRRWRAGVVFQLLGAIRDRLTSIRHYARRRLHLARVRRRYPLDVNALRQADTVIVLWGRATTFSSHDREIKDGWFVELPALLRNSGRRLAYLIQPLDWTDPYEAIAANAMASGEPVLMIEDAYTIGDIVRAAIATLRPPARPLRFQSRNGLDLTFAIRAALWREVRRGAPTLAHLQFGVGRLMHRLGMKPRVVIHLYEGQPWERTLRTSIRSTLPEARVVAVQHMPFPPLFLNSIPSTREISTGNIPDTLLVLGPSIAEYLGSLGFPSDRLTVGGALRFAAARSLGKSGPGRDVLCCTGIDRQESIELADKAAQAVTRFPGLRLVVNFNPQAPAALKTAVKNFVLGRLPANSMTIDFSELGVRDLIGSAGVVLYSDTNAAYEAFAAGCELIFVGRDCALDYDKLPPGWATHCRSVDEIGVVLERWLKEPPPVNRREQRRFELENHLAAVDHNAFLSIV
ncbi:MAG TPA: hypothetical protein VKX28_13510 [Xanthobacteraceae bacterium]|nr:hypothetical protein [Xanthobacteraceae bacterium]